MSRAFVKEDGPDRVDLPDLPVSTHAPLARALIGAGVGDMVRWARPGGAVEMEVLSIEPAPWP